MDLYDRIDILLKEKHSTKKKLCDTTGISYNTLASLFKRRSKNMDVDTIRKIADYFGTSVEYLVTGATTIQRSRSNTVIAYNGAGEIKEYKLTEKQMSALLAFLDSIKE